LNKDVAPHEVAYELSEAVSRYKTFGLSRLSENAISLIDELLLVLSDGHAAVLSPQSRASARREVFGRVNLSHWTASRVGQYIRGIDRRIELQGQEPPFEINLNCADLFDRNYLVIDRRLRELSDDVSRMPLIDAQSISQEYEFVSDLLYLIRQSRRLKKYICCKSCFRAIRREGYCGLHKSAHPNHYRDVSKVFKFLSPEDCDNLARLKSTREVLGDAVAVVSPNNSEVEPGLNSIFVSDTLYEFLCPREDFPWKDASAQIEYLLANRCPRVYEVIKDLTEIASDFSNYVDLCYSRKYLDNPNDSSRSSLWFWVTMFDAEAYFSAIELSEQVSDGRRVDTTERDSLICKLHGEGMSIRDIESHLKASKVRAAGRTTINKVIKKMHA
jgi:hypothetical protein